MSGSPWIDPPPLMPGEPGYDAQVSRLVAERAEASIAGHIERGIDPDTARRIARQHADLDREEIEADAALDAGLTRFRSCDDGYLLDDGLGTSLRVERLRRERGELVGELIVSTGIRGARTVAGVLHAADFNLSSARARTERARILGDRARTDDMDWTGLLEELCQSVLASERRGAAAVDLRQVAPPGPNDDLEVDRLRLPRRHPAIAFGDGGSGKSLIALHAAGQLARQGMTVLYADWEYAPEDHRARLGGLFGDDLPQIYYVRCERPLVAEADRLARLVREHGIDYMVVDSIAFACDGAPESAEVAAAYFRSLRRIGVGSLNIAHVTKSEGADQKPFGSAFWHNGARMTYYVARSVEEDAELVVGIYNRKVNDGARERPFSYRIGFADERIDVRVGDINDVSDLAAKLPLRMRLRSLLRTGAMTYAELGAATESDPETVRKTIVRDKGQTFVKIVTQDGITRWGLRVIDGVAA